MGTVCHCIYTTVSVLLAVRLSSSVDHRDRVFMIRSPEPIAVPIGDEVTLDCEMNIKPDIFKWRHFPISSPYSNEPIKIDTAQALDLPSSMYTISGKQTTVTINVNSTKAAGDYQCLAIYGVSVLASEPGRVSIAEIGEFPPSQSRTYLIAAGNTVAIRCELPPSNPPAAVLYYKSNVLLNQSVVLPTGTLLLQNVNNHDSGTYTCAANNYITGEVRNSNQKSILVITKPSDELHQSPKFLSKPPANYTVTAGETVFMECSAVGDPPPQVQWSKLSGILPPSRSELLPGGLRIKNVTSSDQGTYICEHASLKYHISLLFYERPVVTYKPISDIKEGENLEFECKIKGTPDPVISWLINGHSVLNDTNVEVIGNKIYFSPIAKRHAGILQCLASNVVGSDYGYTFLSIYPKQISTFIDNPTLAPENIRPTKKKKGKSPRGPEHKIMIPPSKPNVTRLSDESVMVRWSVPENDGLPIQFFKVQYRELGLASQQNGNHGRSKSSRWKTTNADIIPHLRSYQVDNLKSDHIYRFRIAAVYSNNDNKLGPNSAKFHLKREDFFTKNPLPSPKLITTEALSPTEIKIYWEYEPNPNITIDGFYINYQLASSAGDYFKATVDGEQARSYVIKYLQPDTSYDIKLQSYTTSGVSDFSAVLKQKTFKTKTETSVTSVIITTSPKSEESTGPPQLNMIIELYMIIEAAVFGVAVIIAVVLTLLICKKRRAKDADRTQDANVRSDKTAAVDESGHHMQVDGNGYIAEAVPRVMSNGCGPPPNRMTITSNPLADADDNQNQSMIEMSCLSSQNNNCSSTEPSASAESEPLPTKVKPSENIKTRSKLKTEPQAGENYV